MSDCHTANCTPHRLAWAHRFKHGGSKGACLQQDVEVGGGLGRDGKARVLVPHASLHKGLRGPLEAAGWPGLPLGVLHQGCVGFQQLPGILRPSCTASSVSRCHLLGAAESLPGDQQHAGCSAGARRTAAIYIMHA